MDYLFLIAGFLLLIKGADWFVDGSAGVARRFRVPTLIIGMTIVAMGTSAPELAVSTAASFKGNNSIAISNVIGSNIFNLMVVCGACALFQPLSIKTSTLKIEFPVSILAAGIFLVLCWMGMSLNRVEGAILMLLFLCFLLWMVRSAKKSREETEEEEVEKSMPIFKCVLYIPIGIAAIVLGGDLVVDSASAIATSFGLSQTLIGLTIVAFGTSLPELVTSLVAAKKGDADMALGNVIGSNIFNVLLILGVAGLVSPMAVLTENIIDGVLLMAMSLVTFLFAWIRSNISRGEGIVMLLMYAAYIFYICLR